MKHSIPIPIYGSYTDRGCCRNENQDAVFCRVFLQKNKKNDRILFPSVTGENASAAGPVPIVLGMVCDGIGGLERGDLASEIVAVRMEVWADKISEWLSPAAAEEDRDVLFDHFKDALEHGNEAVLALQTEYGIRTGTTFSGFFVIGDVGQLLHVGDSRVYRFRPDDAAGLRLLCLTEDECVWREKRGQMRSFLENYVGRAETLSFKSYTVLLRPGDMLIACTDGYYHNFTEDDAAELYGSVASDSSPDGIRAALARGASRMIARGERDNLSAALYIHRTCIPCPGPMFADSGRTMLSYIEKEP